MALMVVLGLSIGVANAGLPTSSPAALAQKGGLSNAAVAGPIVGYEERHDTSPPFRDIKPAAPLPKNGEREIGRHVNPFLGVEDTDTVVQRYFGPNIIPAMPAPILNFNGISFANSTCNCAPPDTNGDVGPTRYVQTTNTAYQVFNKATGASVFGPVAINTLWAGFGGPCQTRNDGDPIVKYDQLADRWVINQFTSAAPYYQCIAVSTTGDPVGSYNRYAFLESNTVFGDYQKIGVWPDGYYMSNNEFTGNTFTGAGNYAFDRSRMLAGLSASYIYFHLPATDWGGQQPSDLDGATLPPAGAPNLFVEIDDSAWDPPNIPTDQIQMWRFHADFAIPANSTFTALTKIVPPQLAVFDGILCNFGNCVPQLGTVDRLDTIADRVMYRVAYRNFGSNESIVFNHTVDAGTDKAAIRWYELRGINATPGIFQQGTYDPDTNHHWMGSIAQDIQGNMALGYSVSSSSMFPAIRYSGRLVGDALGILPQGEATIINGTGSQLQTNGRWGDYSAMTVDPSDDCTFWYTQEYYAVTSAFNWNTRIGSFKFPGCVQGTPTATATSIPPTATRTSTAIVVATATATATPVCLLPDYQITQSDGASIVPGTSYVAGSTCNSCVVTVAMPFAYTLYDQTYTSVNVSNAGNLQFVSSTSDGNNVCLPTAVLNYSILPYWDGLNTNINDTMGVFTSVSGTSPNRIFNIEWRAGFVANDVRPNFEARLYEGQPKFEFIYGVTRGGFSATIGVQKGTGSQFTQYSCNTNGTIIPGRKLVFDRRVCLNGQPLK